PPSAFRLSGSISLEDSRQRLTLRADPNTAYVPGAQYSFALDDGPRPDYVVLGAVKGLPSDAADVWVRFLTVSTNQLREIEVAPDGTFEIYNPVPDRYVVLVLDKTRVLAAGFPMIRYSPTPDLIELTVG